MIIRIALSDAAMDRLTAFCASNIKPEFDASAYAAGLAADADLGAPGDYVVLEIRGSDAVSGTPSTISFEADDDFDFEEIE